MTSFRQDPGSRQRGLVEPVVAADHLVAFRIHGVTPKLIREVAGQGSGDLSADDLVSMKIHGRRR